MSKDEPIQTSEKSFGNVFPLESKIKKNHLNNQTTILKEHSKADSEYSIESEIEDVNSSWFWSKARSFLIYGLAAGAVVIHGISVFLNNIAGGHEHFQPGRIFSQVISSYEMKAERKELKEKTAKLKEKKQESTQKETEKEEKEEQGKSTNKMTEDKVVLKEQQSNESFEQNGTKYQPPHSAADLVPPNTITYKTPDLLNLEQKIDNMIKGTVQNKDNLNLIINELLSQPTIKSVFSELHLTPVSNPDRDEIYLFSDNQEMDIQKIPTLKKDALLFGNASHLTSAIYASQELSESAFVECAAKALIAAVRIKSEIFSRDFNDMRNLLTLENPERYVIANTICETGKEYGIMYATLSYKENYVDLYYKDSFVASVNITEPIEHSLYEIRQQVTEIDKEKSGMVYQFADDISFYRKENSILALTIHGVSKDFPITEEFDLKTVADYIKEQCPERSKIADIDAMLMGITVNPYMNRSIDEAEIEMNPFTNQQKYTSDFVIGHKNGLHYISEQQLEESSLGKGYRQEPIVCVQPYGTPMDFEKLEDVVINYRQEHPVEEHNEEFLIKNSIADFLNQTTIQKDIESPAVKQGYSVWKRLEEGCILDGTDISKFRFIENPEMEKNPREDLESYEITGEIQEDELIM